LDLTAQHRLGDVERFGCAPEVLLLGDGDEVAKFPQIDIHA
jgi:hypothetical protein